MPGSSYALVSEVISGTNTVDDIVWTSSAPSVAEVSSGTVTAISDGTAVITASIGNCSATCSVTVKTPPSVIVKNYVADGVNYGPGINIGGTVWAPVNCGYEPANGDYKGYPYGKLYQWGRKYGHGYSGSLYDTCEGILNVIGEVSDADTPELAVGPVSLSEGQSEDNAEKFYCVSDGSYDWLDTQNDGLWNAGSVAVPVKTDYDPCPTGWRVPTLSELEALSEKNHSSWTTNGEGQSGYYFVGEYTYMEDVPKVFFPAAGFRECEGSANVRGWWGLYWSSDTYSDPDDDTKACCLWISNGSCVLNTYWSRAHGFPVRCVQE